MTYPKTHKMASAFLLAGVVMLTGCSQPSEGVQQLVARQAKWMCRSDGGVIDFHDIRFTRLFSVVCYNGKRYVFDYREIILPLESGEQNNGN